jgi:hypothetical protein
MSEAKIWASTIGGIVALCAAVIYLAGNHAARWNEACAKLGGVKVAVGGARECVIGPVKVVTVPVKPW